jgi:hypothetical protein
MPGVPCYRLSGSGHRAGVGRTASHLVKKNEVKMALRIAGLVNAVVRVVPDFRVYDANRNAVSPPVRAGRANRKVSGVSNADNVWTPLVSERSSNVNTKGSEALLLFG